MPPERFSPAGAGSAGGMRVVVTGASGNVGSALLKALAGRHDVVGLVRRPPEPGFLGAEWRQADVAADDLVAHFDGADAVVHLAWLLQPSHDLGTLQRVNVIGSARVLEAAAASKVGRVVVASSVGAYSPAPRGTVVDESWPTDGVPTSSYSRQKAYVERLLDLFECRHREVAVARLRPGLVFQAAAAPEISRYFAGHLPARLGRVVNPEGLPALPWVTGLSFQAVHAEDLAAALAQAVETQARGPFNIAADPVVDGPTLADHFGTRLLPISPTVVRAAVALSWRARLQPTEPGWVDLATSAPRMATDRARAELGWRPARSALEALDDLFEGLRGHGGLATPPLDAGGRQQRRG